MESFEQRRLSPKPSVVVALMIGEMDHMPTLNSISAGIVKRAVKVWFETPESVLICESTPMSVEARRLGVPEADLVTALPQSVGHTTRLVALWLADSAFARGSVRLVTHAIHARRALKIFRKVGITATTIGLDLPFNPQDPDWKLRSGTLFRAYNLAAYAYCVCRGWI